jgi:2-(1,2-epoxy-1,2-dihydrophenyl)acetyl-CoA isomerase
MSLVETLHNHVLTLRIDRPERMNALTFELLTTLCESLERVPWSAEVRVVVITGTGRAFCAGQDLAAFGQTNGQSLDIAEMVEKTYNRLMMAIATLEKPVITAVNGTAAGAGASLALAGDLRLWSSAAKFTEAFSNIALIPDGGSTWFLPRAVGYSKALELSIFAEVIDAAEGFRLGLCERVFEAETFAEQVQAYAERLASRPATAVALTKKALQQGMVGTLRESLTLEAQLQAQASRSSDHQEGVHAFMEKRKPEFNK